MATRYWVGGTGTWDNSSTTNWSTSSGGAGGASVPTSSDNVYFDSNSGTGTVTFGAGASLNMATLTASTSSLSYTTTGATISWATTFSFSAGTLSLGASTMTPTSGGTLSLTGGTINLNSATITCGTFTAGAGATLNAGTSSITVTNGNFTGSNNTFYEVIFTRLTGRQSISGSNTFTRLITSYTSNPSNVIGLNLPLSATQTIAAGGVLTLSGYSAGKRAVVGVGWPSTSTISVPSSATVTLTNVDFEGVQVTGTAAPISGTQVGNLLRNSGITFTTAGTRYAVATGNFSSTGTWSTSSGGSSGANPPLPQDSAILNSASGSITITNDTSSSACNNFTCTGFTGTFTSSRYLTVSGNFTLSSGMTFSSSGLGVILTGTAKTLTSAGKSFAELSVSYGASYTATDAVSVAGAFYAVGDFTAQGNVTCQSFQANFSYGNSVVMGSGTWTLTGSVGTVWTVADIASLSAASAPIVLSGTGSSTRTFTGDGQTYNSLTIGGPNTGDVVIQGSNTFSAINNTNTSAYSLKFTSGTTTTVGAWGVSGVSSGTRVTITSTSASTHNLVYSGAGKIDAEFLAISYSTASPGTTWYAGDSSLNNGNNSGWIFSSSTPKGNSLFFGSNF